PRQSQDRAMADMSVLAKSRIDCQRVGSLRPAVVTIARSAVVSASWPGGALWSPGEVIGSLFDAQESAKFILGDQLQVCVLKLPSCGVYPLDGGLGLLS